jgi:hypothetical protein
LESKVPKQDNLYTMREDVCDECTIYRNCWKYGAQAEEDSEQEDAKVLENNDDEDEGS